MSAAARRACTILFPFLRKFPLLTGCPSSPLREQKRAPGAVRHHYHEGDEGLCLFAVVFPAGYLLWGANLSICSRSCLKPSGFSYSKCNLSCKGYCRSLAPEQAAHGGHIPPFFLILIWWSEGAKPAEVLSHAGRVLLGRYPSNVGCVVASW
jgi:hypothetical protein